MKQQDSRNFDPEACKNVLDDGEIQVYGRTFQTTGEEELLSIVSSSHQVLLIRCQLGTGSNKVLSYCCIGEEECDTFQEEYEKERSEDFFVYTNSPSGSASTTRPTSPNGKQGDVSDDAESSDSQQPSQPAASISSDTSVSLPQDSLITWAARYPHRNLTEPNVFFSTLLPGNKVFCFDTDPDADGRVTFITKEVGTMKETTIGYGLCQLSNMEEIKKIYFGMGYQEVVLPTARVEWVPTYPTTPIEQELDSGVDPEILYAHLQPGEYVIDRGYRGEQPDSVLIVMREFPPEPSSTATTDVLVHPSLQPQRPPLAYCVISEKDLTLRYIERIGIQPSWASAQASAPLPTHFYPTATPPSTVSLAAAAAAASVLPASSLSTAAPAVLPPVVSPLLLAGASASSGAPVDSLPSSLPPASSLPVAASAPQDPPAASAAPAFAHSTGNLVTFKPNHPDPKDSLDFHLMPCKSYVLVKGSSDAVRHILSKGADGERQFSGELDRTACRSVVGTLTSDGYTTYSPLDPKKDTLDAWLQQAKEKGQQAWTIAKVAVPLDPVTLKDISTSDPYFIKIDVANSPFVFLLVKNGTDIVIFPPLAQNTAQFLAQRLLTEKSIKQLANEALFSHPALEGADAVSQFASLQDRQHLDALLAQSLAPPVAAPSTVTSTSSTGTSAASAAAQVLQARPPRRGSPVPIEPPPASSSTPLSTTKEGNAGSTATEQMADSGSS